MGWSVAWGSVMTLFIWGLVVVWAECGDGSVIFRFAEVTKDAGLQLARGEDGKNCDFEEDLEGRSQVVDELELRNSADGYGCWNSEGNAEILDFEGEKLEIEQSSREATDLSGEIQLRGTLDTDDVQSLLGNAIGVLQSLEEGNVVLKSSESVQEVEFSIGDKESMRMNLESNLEPKDGASVEDDKELNKEQEDVPSGVPDAHQGGISSKLDHAEVEIQDSSGCDTKGDSTQEEESFDVVAEPGQSTGGVSLPLVMDGPVQASYSETIEESFDDRLVSEERSLEDSERPKVSSEAESASGVDSESNNFPVKISKPSFLLSSGAALLPHPAKVTLRRF